MSGRRIVRGTLAVLIALIAAALLWLGYLGAFGGARYVDLPAASVGAGTQPDLAAVIFSGDMGFRIGMGPRLGRRLASAGMPVTGVNSLVYFRKRRTRADVDRFIADAMRHALAVSKAKRLALIGQSFGADMLHVGLTGLPSDLRDKVASVALVVPTDTVFFRISPAEMFEWTAPDAPALATARQLNWVPVLCVHGVEEKDSLCPLLHQPGLESAALPGGHDLHHDVDRLFRTIWARMERLHNGRS